MNQRKGLIIGIVVACLALAVVSFFVLGPRSGAHGSEYEKLKTKSEEMAQKQLEAAPPPEVPQEVVEPPTGKGPQRIGG